jgi:hypothetical protein
MMVWIIHDESKRDPKNEALLWALRICDFERYDPLKAEAEERAQADALIKCRAKEREEVEASKLPPPGMVTLDETRKRLAVMVEADAILKKKEDELINAG